MADRKRILFQIEAVDNATKAFEDVGKAYDKTASKTKRGFKVKTDISQVTPEAASQAAKVAGKQVVSVTASKEGIESLNLIKSAIETIRGMTAGGLIPETKFDVSPYIVGLEKVQSAIKETQDQMRLLGSTAPQKGYDKGLQAGVVEKIALIKSLADKVNKIDIRVNTAKAEKLVQFGDIVSRLKVSLPPSILEKAKLISEFVKQVNRITPDVKVAASFEKQVTALSGAIGKIAIDKSKVNALVTTVASFQKMFQPLAGDIPQITKATNAASQASALAKAMNTLRGIGKDVNLKNLTKVDKLREILKRFETLNAAKIAGGLNQLSMAFSELSKSMDVGAQLLVLNSFLARTQQQQKPKKEAGGDPGYKFTLDQYARAAYGRELAAAGVMLSEKDDAFKALRKYDKNKAAYLLRIAGRGEFQQEADIIRKRLAQERMLLGEAGHGGITGAGKRVILWGAASFAVYRFSAAMAQAVRNAIELENQLIQLQKVMGSATDFRKFEGELFKIAEEYGRSIFDIIEISKIWAQQGYDNRDVLSLTGQTVKTMAALNVDAATATDYLTSVMRVFNLEIRDLDKNLSSLMNVQAKYAIESGDLAIIFSKVGAGIRAAGDDMDFLAGMSTALRETTRKTANQIATIIKSIYARAFRPDTMKFLQEQGFSVKVDEKTYRSFSDILREIRDRWSELSDVQRRQTAQTVGGIRYWSDFFAVMDNFEIVENASRSFLQAWDEGTEASDLQTKSMINQIQSMKTAVLELSELWANSSIAPVISKVMVPAVRGLANGIEDLHKATGGLLPGFAALTTAGAVAGAAASANFLFGGAVHWEALRSKLKVSSKDLEFARARWINLGQSAKSAGGQVRGFTATITNWIQRARGLAATNDTVGKSFQLVYGGAVAAANGIKAVGKSVLAFSAVTIAISALIYAAEKLYDVLSKSFEGPEPISDEVLEKYREFGKTIKETGEVIVTPREGIANLKEVAKIIHELQPEVGHQSVSWDQVYAKVQLLAPEVRDKLNKTYVDLNSNLDSQKKLWEDINRLVAYLNNVLLEKMRTQFEENKEGIEDVVNRYTSGVRVIEALLVRVEEVGYQGLTAIEQKALNTAVGNVSAITKKLFGKQFSDQQREFLDQIMRAAREPGTLGSAPRFRASLMFGDITAEDIKNLESMTKGTKDLARAVLENKDIIEQGLAPGLDSLYNAPEVTIKKAQLQAHQDAIDVFNEIPKVMEQVARDVDEGWNALLDVTKRPIKYGVFVDIPHNFVGEVTEIVKALDDLSAVQEKLAIRNRLGIGKGLSSDLKEVSEAYDKYIDQIIEKNANLPGEIASLERVVSQAYDDLVTGPLKSLTADSDVYIKKVKEVDFDLANVANTIVDYNNLVSSLKKQSLTDPDTLREEANRLDDEDKIQKHHISELANNVESLQKKRVELAEAQAALLTLPQKIAERQSLGIDLTGLEIIKESAVRAIQAEVELFKASQSAYQKLVDLDRDFANDRDEHIKRMLDIEDRGYRDRLQVIVDGVGREYEARRQALLSQVELQKKEAKAASEQKVLGVGDANLIEDAKKKAKAELEDQIELIDKRHAIELDNLNTIEQQAKAQALLSEAYSIQESHADSLKARLEDVRSVIVTMLTDFETLVSDKPQKALVTALKSFGSQFVKSQAEVFVNNITKGLDMSSIFLTEDDIKFAQRMNDTKKMYDDVRTAQVSDLSSLSEESGRFMYQMTYSAIVDAYSDLKRMGFFPNIQAPEEADVADALERVKAIRMVRPGVTKLPEIEGSDIDPAQAKKIAAIIAAANFATPLALGAAARGLGKDEQGVLGGWQAGQGAAVTIASLAEALGVKLGAMGGPWGILAGGAIGAIGSLIFGKDKEEEKKQDEMIESLRSIDRHMARIEDLAESVINVPGTVFIPPGSGGFTINGNVVLQPSGPVQDPSAFVDEFFEEVSRRNRQAARTNGARGYMF